MSEAQADLVPPIVNAQRWLVDPDDALFVLEQYLTNPDNWTTTAGFMGGLLVVGLIVSRVAQYLPGVGGMIGQWLNKALVAGATKQQQEQAKRADATIHASIHYARSLEPILERLAPEALAEARAASKQVQAQLGVRDGVREFLAAYDKAHASTYETAAVEVTGRLTAKKDREQAGNPALEPNEGGQS